MPERIQRKRTKLNMKTNIYRKIPSRMKTTLKILSLRLSIRTYYRGFWDEAYKWEIVVRDKEEVEKLKQLIA